MWVFRFKALIYQVSLFPRSSPDRFPAPSSASFLPFLRVVTGSRLIPKELVCIKC
jgi:hypothetical protein